MEFAEKKDELLRKIKSCSGVKGKSREMKRLKRELEFAIQAMHKESKKQAKLPLPAEPSKSGEPKESEYKAPPHPLANYLGKRELPVPKLFIYEKENVETSNFEFQRLIDALNPILSQYLKYRLLEAKKKIVDESTPIDKDTLSSVVADITIDIGFAIDHIIAKSQQV